MLRVVTGCLVTAFAAALCGIAAAQGTDTTMIPTPPKPDLSSMNFLLGTWNCESKSARRPSASKSTVSYAQDPSGYWIVGTTHAPGVPWYPHASISTDYITYDASTKRWVDISYDDTGGYDFTTSDGWHGNTLVWHDITYSKANDLSSNSDTTQTKVSPAKLTFENTFTTTAGKTVGVAGTCNKT